MCVYLMKCPARGWYPRAGRTSVVGPRDALTMSMGQATDGGKRPMHVLPLAKRAEVVEHLMEGNAIRPTSRLCGVDKNTVLSLLLTVARGA